MSRATLAAAALTLAACRGGESNADQGRPIPCFAGDRQQPPEIQLVYRTGGGVMKAIADMAEIPLIQPPQGGKVLFIGVRARNLDGCPLTLSTALLDADTGAVVSFEVRPVLLEPDPDAAGWLRPRNRDQMGNYANLPACPRAHLSQSVPGGRFRLAVTAEDPGERKAQATLSIVPVCGEPDLLEQCQCQCSRDYKLGSVCGAPPDGAAP
jgi:hypothetical protein